MKRTSLTHEAIWKKLKSLTKALTRVPVLITALLLSSFSAPAASGAPEKKSINERVELVRDTLKRKATNGQIPTSSLSNSESTQVPWGNWGNWGNWANWGNWNNWNNWGNWGNWRNF